MNKLETALVFGSHMVLQRGKELTVWGKGSPGQQVQVKVQDECQSSMIDDQGIWSLILKPLSASEQETMIISSGNESLTYVDVAVGDVWIAGGQSNMEFGMYSDRNFEQEKEGCKNDNIRFFDYPKVSYDEQLDSLPHNSEGFWRTCDAENLTYFSAVGYYFAKEIQAEEQVPVGVIGCNWGGSTISCWMDKAYSGRGQVWWDEYEDAVSKLDMEQYEEAIKMDFSAVHNDWIDTPYAQFMCQDATFEGLKAALEMSNVPVLVGPKSPNRPSGLYDTMLKKLVPYQMKGVVWYQGESDDVKAEVYGELQEGLIKCWRDLWQEELPFLFVQLPPYEGYGRLSGARFPEIREHQQWVEDHVPGTAMAVITDTGSRYDIHPKEKHSVGERLALQALQKVYKRNILGDSPRLTSGRKEDGKIILEFSNVGNGLMLEGEQISALELFQSERLIADYQFEIAENRILIEADDIGQDIPVQVQLAYTPYYKVNLYNSEKLPVRPGRINIL